MRRLRGTICSQLIEANVITGCATECPTLSARVTPYAENIEGGALLWVVRHVGEDCVSQADIMVVGEQLFMALNGTVHAVPLLNPAAICRRKRRRRRTLYLKSHKIVNITLANSLLHRLHTQYVQQNIQYLQQNIQMKRKYHVCKLSS